jgi:hypothetical protein
MENKIISAISAKSVAIGRRSVGNCTLKFATSQARRMKKSL